MKATKPAPELEKNDLDYFLGLSVDVQEEFLAGLPLEEYEAFDRELCRHSFEWFLTRHGVIVDEAHGPDDPEVYIGLDLWPAKFGQPGQPEFVVALLSTEDLIALKARQLGLSWIRRNYEYWKMEFFDNVRLGIVDKNDDDAMEQLQRVVKIRLHMPPHLRTKPMVRGYDNKHKFGLGDKRTQSTLQVAACTPGAARGITAREICLEEFAHYEQAELVYAAVRGTAADKGRRIIILSTANGEGNKFYELWIAAVKGLNKFLAFFIPWYIHPDRDEEWYADKLLDMGEALMKQEFPATADEAFIASGTKWLDTAFIRALKDQHTRQPLRNMENGAWSIFIEPVPGRQYVIGADVADGGGDACSADVADVETGEIVAHIESYNWSADEFGDHLFALGQLYNWACLGVERNNNGIATLSVLVRMLRYPNIYHHQHWDHATNTAVPRPGWITDKSTRPVLLSDLKRALERLQLLVRHEETYRQLTAFGYYKGKLQAPPGDHDDCVISAGITEQVRQWVLQFGQPQEIVIYQGEDRIG